jgi:hypothetical protein
MKTASFSLTLTLSRWEREQPLPDSVKLGGQRAEPVFGFAMKQKRDFARRLGAFLPLLEGEGRGEGKLTGQTSKMKQ